MLSKGQFLNRQALVAKSASSLSGPNVILEFLVRMAMTDEGDKALRNVRQTGFYFIHKGHLL